MRIVAVCSVLVLGLVSSCRSGAPAERPTPAASSRTTVEQSNANAQKLLAVLAAFVPEYVGQLGFPGLDEQILDIKPHEGERFRARLTLVMDSLKARQAEETDPFVLQDLEILQHAAGEYMEESALEDRLLLPYVNLDRVVLVCVRSLLNDKVPPERRAAVATRLKRYAGLEAGYTPVTELARGRLAEALPHTELLGPARLELEDDLLKGEVYRKGVAGLLAEYPVAGAEDAWNTLRGQLQKHEQLLRQQLLPRARDDFRLPEEMYRFHLRKNGVALDPLELAAAARVAFKQTQADMNTLAAVVAKAHGIEAASYREVIRALKREQLKEAEVVPHYEARVKQLEDIIRREKLVTLPARSMKFRVATPAEAAQSPAPHIDLQGLLSADGELAFVLPMGVTGEEGAKDAAHLKYDDFTFAAASWTITAHEGRPGHDLQLSAAAERGVSTARTLFALNATNVEGWALYAEAISRPFMPEDGRLISLQHLLLRAARAFLDPELQLGRISLEDARHILEDDVVLSPALAKEELDRYTFGAPGQAPCYYYGYTQLLSLRNDVKAALGPRYNAMQFHDFVISQGLLPPPLLRRATMDGLVRSQ